MNQNQPPYYTQNNIPRKTISPPPYNPEFIGSQICYYCQGLVDTVNPQNNNIYLTCMSCKTIMHDRCLPIGQTDICPKCGSFCQRSLTLPYMVISPPSSFGPHLDPNLNSAIQSPSYQTAITIPPNYGTATMIHHKSHHDGYHGHHDHHSSSHYYCSRKIISSCYCILFCLAAIIIVILFLMGKL